MIGENNRHRGNSKIGYLLIDDPSPDVEHLTVCKRDMTISQFGRCLASNKLELFLLNIKHVESVVGNPNFLVNRTSKDVDVTIHSGAAVGPPFRGDRVALGKTHPLTFGKQFHKNIINKPTPILHFNTDQYHKRLLINNQKIMANSNPVLIINFNSSQINFNLLKTKQIFTATLY